MFALAKAPSRTYTGRQLFYLGMLEHMLGADTLPEARLYQRALRRSVLSAYAECRDEGVSEEAGALIRKYVPGCNAFEHQCSILETDELFPYADRVIADLHESRLKDLDELRLMRRARRLKAQENMADIGVIRMDDSIYVREESEEEIFYRGPDGALYSPESFVLEGRLFFDLTPAG